MAGKLVTTTMIEGSGGSAMTKLQEPDCLLWKKSSASRDGACVEVAAAEAEELMLVRDSKNRQGPILVFSMAEWNAVISDVRTN